MLVIVSMVIPIHNTEALSCLPYSITEDFEISKAVFLGNAMNVKSEGLESKIKVLQAWKGVKDGDIVDVKSTDPKLWGVQLKNDYQYLIFSKTEKPYTLGLCESSREVINEMHIKNAKDNYELEYYTQLAANDKIQMAAITAQLDLLSDSTITEPEHAIGTNVVDKTGTVYRMQGGLIANRAPYTSAGAFLSYKFNTWKEVQPANDADMAAPIMKDGNGNPQFIIPRPGSLINDKGTIYLITNNARIAFSNETAFKGLGYSFDNAYPGDTSFMLTHPDISSAENPHPEGTLINDNGTLYVTAYEGKIGIPSMAVLESWGYWISDAVPANSYDSIYSNLKTAEMRKPYELHLLEN